MSDLSRSKPRKVDPLEPWKALARLQIEEIETAAQAQEIMRQICPPAVLHTGEKVEERSLVWKHLLVSIVANLTGANGIGDLQVGERYCNMDFVLLLALIVPIVADLTEDDDDEIPELVPQDWEPPSTPHREAAPGSEPSIIPTFPTLPGPNGSSFVSNHFFGGGWGVGGPAWRRFSTHETFAACAEGGTHVETHGTRIRSVAIFSRTIVEYHRNLRLNESFPPDPPILA
ncbi:hypothetical protein B0H11DRAFT_2246804 [Mycena galericulata]|nr:hypothetical protein B0H11DRAFT_2246804 [Mycena galericulata]